MASTLGPKDRAPLAFERKRATTNGAGIARAEIEAAATGANEIDEMIKAGRKKQAASKATWNI
eukprot:6687060-Pyramimonas_sp.AAC.1